MSKRRIGSLIATILFFAAITVAALNIQRIQDWALYQLYEPTAEVASLAIDSGMSDHGTFLFYASQPALQQAKEFNQQCEKREHSTAILGCYDGYRIYIYDIADPRLAGVRPTTAAHEMLHAGFRRLSDKDKEVVGALIDAEYEKLKNNEELASRMAFYERTQPGERQNELHSIIGTEVRDIHPELEAHYRRYFSDRTKVVSQHEQYYVLFKELQVRAETIKQELSNLKEYIDSQTVSYAAKLSELNSAIANFNARADRGEFESRSDFNRERQVLMARSAELRELQGAIEAAVQRYNTLVIELNGIATETDALNRSMDSQLAPAPSL